MSSTDETANTTLPEENQEPHSSGPLLLPAPSADSNDVTKLEVDSGVSLKLDSLGPMVVNSNGTLSRISNWAEMSDLERTRTVRILLKRNQIRLSDQEKKLLESDASEKP